ncbi:hypothetical protein AB0F95_16485 [Micromonospora tulbaghiae]|uniref:hypothetical protein n=1 Tax=Micromonospora tulbaghiae TaxID=479978 RepID=UPI0033EB118F
MSTTSPLLVPLVGLTGVLLGGAIQFLVARGNRLHDRRVALEVRRAEMRLNTYVRLVQHVADCEHLAGRKLSVLPSDEIERSSLGGGAVGESLRSGLPRVDGLTDAELLTFGGPVLNIVVASWAHAKAQVDAVNTTFNLVKLLTAGDERYPKVRFDGDDLDLLSRARDAAERNARRTANNLVNQVKAELAGDLFFRPYSRFRGRMHRKREQIRAVADNEFIQEIQDRYSRILDPVVEAASRSGGGDEVDGSTEPDFMEGDEEAVRPAHTAGTRCRETS